MRSLFSRFRHTKMSGIEAELLASRPAAPKGLVESIVAMVRPRYGARPARLRLAFAGGLTVALVAVAGATGGLSYAASAIAQVTRVVHITSQSPPSLSAPVRTAACNQYAVAPFVTGISPTSGVVGSSVLISGLHFSGNSAVSSVKFRLNRSASFLIINSMKLTATIPVGAVTGGITVSNCAGSATSTRFTVLKPPCHVPNVIGMELLAAKAAIIAANCRSVNGYTQLHPWPKPPGTSYYVTAQTPAAGRTVPNGTYIVLTAYAR